MSKYLGRGVILLGEVSSFAGDDHTIILKTSDGTNVRVSLPPGEQLSGSVYSSWIVLCLICLLVLN
jgi:hypothetical protein